MDNVPQLQKQESNMLYNVVHKCLGTDNLVYATELIEASSAQEALNFYNAMAKEKDKYPYMWNQVKLDNVSESKIYKATALQSLKQE